MVEADPALAARNREMREVLTAHFGPPRDGLPYERYIERVHRPDDTDLQLLRRHGYFRFPIPRGLGGEGASKADYYLLTVATHRLADVAVSLTIQVNSSLGTTPVLLARDKDLPRAQRDLGPFVGEVALQAEVRERLQKVLGKCAAGDAAAAAGEAAELKARLEQPALASAVLRGLSGGFAKAWGQALRIVEARDMVAAGPALQKALDAWDRVLAAAAELHEEIGRRREACDLFLRWVASGQISAFALTEPSAGSDTARVATRAKLRSVLVTPLPDGSCSFLPEAGKEERRVLDARRLVFQTAAVDGRAELLACYRWSDAAEPAAIRFDEYDYESDDPRHARYYEALGSRVHFTDVAQLRERGGRSWYDYWELNGSKMWITNGRVMGIMCLYAKTDAGVTGFIVDRHA
jgi:alkylation response protein AidB-like acyl-CoA dehydrogenase